MEIYSYKGLRMTKECYNKQIEADIAAEKAADIIEKIKLLVNQ